MRRLKLIGQRTRCRRDFFLNKAINFERLGLNWETLLQPYPAKVDVRGIKVAECLSCLNVAFVKIFTGK